VLLRFTSEQENIAPSDLELISQGDGTFSAKGTYLSVPGAWQVQAIVRRENTFDAYANFNFSLPKPGAANEGTANATRQSGVLLLLAALLCGFVAFDVDIKPASRLVTGMPLTFLLIGLGVFLLSQPAPVSTERINPIPLSAESIATGQALFSTNCAPCHGETGKGDGPVGVTLNPRPADLTQHAVVGIHTDAQLFEWITNGFPGSRMPAFKSALSDTERWHLVNFIRSLAPK
jgi:mono/diheme cytochrome c family protein